MEEKTWVIVQRPNGARQYWRDYGHVAWGSPAYRVLGYVHGGAQAVRQFLAQLPAGSVERLGWETPIRLSLCGDRTGS